MADNRLIVEVIGDTAKLQSSLRGAEAQINQFARRTSTVKSTGADKLLASVRGMQGEAAELTKQLSQIDTSADRTGRSLGQTAIAAGVAGVAMNTLGRNLSSLGGESKRVGDALNALTTGNFVGFVQSARQEVHSTTAELVKVGDAARLSAIANQAAAAGFDGLARSAREAAAAVGEAERALVLSTLAARPDRPSNFDDPSTFGLTALEPNEKFAARKKGITASQRNQFFDNALARSLDRVQDAELRGQVAKLQQIADTIEERISVTKDITRKLTLEDELAAVVRQRKGVEETIAKNAATAAEAARLAAQRLREEREARAKALEEARKIAIQSKQFRALGQAADGSDVVPGVANLQKQLASLTDRLAGSSVNLSSKLESQLAGVRKVLSGQLGAATRESRSLIAQLFETIRSEFDKGASGKGPLTKTMGLDTKRIIEGLGLSTGQASEIRGRLSGVNSAGRSNAPVVESHVTVQLDGHTVGKTVTRSQQKRKKRNPTQRRGPNRGS